MKVDKNAQVDVIRVIDEDVMYTLLPHMYDKVLQGYAVIIENAYGDMDVDYVEGVEELEIKYGVQL